MTTIKALWLLIKSLFLKVFTVNNVSDEPPMEAYYLGPGEHFLLIGDDVYRLPSDFTCDEFLALKMKELHQFKKCSELTRSFFEPAVFE